MDEIARLELEFDTSSAEQGANKTTQLLDNVGAHASSMGAALTKALDQVKNGLQFLGLGFGLLKASEALQDAIQLAARYQTLGVVLHQVGERAGYTAQSLDKMAISLQKSGITMRESRAGLIDLIQSNISLAGAANLARVAQDAAVTANLNSSDTYQRVIYGIQSGNSEILRTIGLTVNWNDAYQRMANTLNKSVDDLSEQEQAQARVNEVLHAGINITGAYESAMTTASKQMRSMERYSEDLKVRLGEIFQPVYTQIVFGFASALELASQHTALLASGLLFLGAKAIMPSIVGMASWIKNQAAMRLSVLEGNSVMLGSRAAILMAAEARQADAIAAVEEAEANAAASAATLASAGAAGADAAATAADALAKETLTAATTALEVATNALNAALRTSPWGLVMLAISAAAIVWDALSKKTLDATESTNKYADNISKLSPAMKEAIADAQTLADKRNKGAITKDGKSIEDDISASRKARDEKAASAMDFSGWKGEGFRKGAEQINALNSAYDNGKIQADEYATALNKIGRENSDLENITDNIIAALAGEKEASIALADAKGKLTGKTKEQAEAEEQLNVAMNKATRNASHQADVSEAHLKVLTQSGGRAAKTFDAFQKPEEAGRTEFQSEISRIQDVSSLTYDQVMGAKNPEQMQNLINSAIKANGPNDQGALLRRRDAKRALSQVQQNIIGFQNQEYRSAAADYTSAQQDEQQTLAYSNKNASGAVDDQRRLAAAYREGVPATRAAEAAIAGLVAARSLDKDALPEQRAAAQANAVALTLESQATQLVSSATQELTKNRYAAIDATRLATAALNGPAAYAQAQLDVAATAIQRPGGALENTGTAQHGRDMAEYYRTTDAVNIGASDQNVGKMNAKTEEQKRLTAATKEGKQAAFEQTIVNEVQSATDALQVRNLKDRADAVERLTKAIRASHEEQQSTENAAALRDMQLATTLTREETSATLDGIAATEKFRIAKAGQLAAQNFVGSDANGAKELAVAAAEDQERANMALSRAQQLAEAFRHPMLEAINDVEHSFESLFDKILDHGLKSFHELGRALEDSLHKAFASFVSDTITNAIKQKLTDMYRKSQGLDTGGNSGSGVGAMSGAAQINIKSIGGKDIAAAAAGGFGALLSGAKTGIGEIAGLFHHSNVPDLNPEDALGMIGSTDNGAGGGMAAPNPSGKGAALSTFGKVSVGIGAAIGGWDAGEAMGQMTTNKAVGALGGAVTGAASGAAMGAALGPVGAAIGGIVGGLSGAVSGFIHVGSMSHDAARELQQGRDAMVNSLSSFKEVSTMSQSIVVDQLRQNTETRQSLIAQANAALPGKKYEAERNAQIDAANQAAQEGVQTIFKNFRISIDQQLQAIQGTTFEAALYNLKLAYDNNARSMAAMGANATEAAKATDLYNLSVAKLTKEHQLDIETTKAGIAANIIELQGATYSAELMRMRTQDQNELNSVMEKWGSSNPEIVASEKELIRIREQRAGINLSDEQRNGPAGFKIAGYAYEFATLADQFAKSIQETISGITGGISSPNVTPVAPITINLPPGAIAIDGNQTPVEMAQDFVAGLRQVAASHGGLMGKPLSKVLDEF